MTCTSASHQGAIKTLWLRLWEDVMLSIFIQSLDAVSATHKLQNKYTANVVSLVTFSIICLRRHTNLTSVKDKTANQNPYC